MNWQLLGVLVFQWSLYIRLYKVTFIYESIRYWPRFFGQDGSILAKFISGFYEPRRSPGQWTRKRPIFIPLDQTSLVKKVFIVLPKTELSLAGPTREIPSGQHGPLLAVRVAHHNTGFASPWPLADQPYNKRYSICFIQTKFIGQHFSVGLFKIRQENLPTGFSGQDLSFQHEGNRTPYHAVIHPISCCRQMLLCSSWCLPKLQNTADAKGSSIFTFYTDVEQNLASIQEISIFFLINFQVKSHVL